MTVVSHLPTYSTFGGACDHGAGQGGAGWRPASCISLSRIPRQFILSSYTVPKALQCTARRPLPEPHEAGSLLGPGLSRHSWRVAQSFCKPTPPVSREPRQGDDIPRRASLHSASAKERSWLRRGSCVTCCPCLSGGHRLGVRGLSVPPRTASPSEVFGEGATDPALPDPSLGPGLQGEPGCVGTDAAAAWGQTRASPILLTFFLLSFYYLNWGEAAGIGFEVIIKISTCLRQTIVG